MNGCFTGGVLSQGESRNEHARQVLVWSLLFGDYMMCGTLMFNNLFLTCRNLQQLTAQAKNGNRPNNTAFW